MTETIRQQFSTPQQATTPKRILLLADDGRMEELLRRCPVECEVVKEANVLDGIARLGLRGKYPDQNLTRQIPRCDLVLLNVERPGHKTVQVTRALRRVGADTKIVLYGEAFGEIYAQPALKAGADDYLVWPIPLSELMTYIKGDTKPQRCRRLRGDVTSGTLRNAGLSERKSPTDVETGQFDTKILTTYHSLAQLVPQGVETLIRQAEKAAADLLRVEWVKIFNTAINQGQAKERQTVTQLHGSAVPLIAPPGQIGIMASGPRRNGTSPLHETRLDEQQGKVERVAEFIATLMYLAQRDETLKKLAMTDELTGVHNRRYLKQFMRQIIQQSQHEHTQLTLLLFDIDEFKHYNDTYGHGAGDKVLKQATRLIRRCCREHDVVARIGGDEFAVLFWDSGQKRRAFADEAGSRELSQATNDRGEGVNASTRTHPEMVMFLSNRFRRLMMTNDFPSLGPEARGVLTISGGLAGFPWDGKTVDELTAAADEALLNAKRSGKNRIYLVGQPEEKVSAD